MVKCRFRCAYNSSVSRVPAKQDDAAASMTFSTRFGSVQTVLSMLMLVDKPLN